MTVSSAGLMRWKRSIKSTLVSDVFCSLMSSTIRPRSRS